MATSSDHLQRAAREETAQVRRGGASRPWVFGTRGSALAMWQTRWVLDRLREGFPDIALQVEPIKTQGDRTQQLNVPLARLADQSIFVAELEQALLAGSAWPGEQAPQRSSAEVVWALPAIDAAVHSLKDLASVLPDGLVLAAVTPRDDPRDALVSRHSATLAALAPGATVATGSLRRRAQLLHLRPDLRIVEIRGNVDTRVRKALDPAGPDAVVLAVAGLRRLGLERHITQYFSTDELVPAAGQGALAVEIRRTDHVLRHLLAAIDHAPSHQAARAERAVLAALGGGCRVPLGAYAVVVDDGATIELLAVVASPDGRDLVRTTMRGPASQPARLGRLAAAQLRRAGATAMLRAVRTASASGEDVERDNG
ncbi:MAG TPA: hydroxymethylbilane synthase [Ktedonobacterales bacterium]|nr:hydroxymethylbilane synthase [Ktedonobacterales bacterium]